MHRDQWVADTQRETSGLGTHGLYVNLYLNGLYWGVYNLGERPDIDYAVSYLGGNKDGYDVFNGEELKDGNTNALNALLTIARAGVTNETAWSNVWSSLDVPGYIDFLLINWYTINHDWIGHNYWLDGSITQGIPFHLFTWDAETSFDIFRSAPLDYPVIEQTASGFGVSSVLFVGLRDYPEFRRLFADHAQKHLFNHGALTPERSAARWMQRASELDTAIIAESVRWGIADWWADGWVVWDTKEFTRDDWVAEQTYLMTNWFPNRTAILIDQLRTAGLYPELDAPVLTPHGGIIVGTLPVVISPPLDATLYYTTNGTDPRLPDGNVSPDAFTSAQPIQLDLTVDTVLRARAFSTNTWSALTEATYVVSDAVALQISNISRRKDNNVELDFVAWPGLAYTLRAGTDVSLPTAAWEAIATIVPFPDGTITYVDTTATNFPARYYQLTWP